MIERVQKIIASAGICSRRKAEEVIQEGKVKVNGQTITLGDKANAKIDKVEVNGKLIQPSEKIYYMLHKPKRYITTSVDMYGRKKVTDLVPLNPRVFSVGRLDRDSTGFLILTNDGEFANLVTHPSNKVEKTYIAILDKPFERKHKEQLERGIIIEKHKVKPKIVQLDKNTVAVTLHVGIHKVVKRILKEVGFYVRQLHRTHIGSLALDVEVGTYRLLTKEDIRQIFIKNKITKKTFID
jgi:23S rRNA pseudouridine2605 synthase